MAIVLTSTGLPLLAATGLAAAGTPPVPLPRPVLLPPTRSISHRGVTFNFSSEVRYILSATGEPVLIAHPDYLESTVYLTSITPISQADQHGQIMNGAMIDPLIEGGMPPSDTYVAGRAFGQGFDQMMNTNDGSNELTYVGAMNDDPSVAGAIAIAPGSRFTIVKSVRDPAKTGSGMVFRPILRYVPLTVMDSLPPQAGTWFRPAASLDASKMVWKHRLEDLEANIDYRNGFADGVLRNLRAPSGMDGISAHLGRVRDQEMLHMPFWIDGQGDRIRRVTLSKEEGPASGYARDMARVRMLHACALHLDPAGDPIEKAAKRDLAIILAQWGIDIDGCSQMGLRHHSGAGQQHGTQPFIYIAAFLLGDDDMLARARTHEGNAINQLWWVGESHVGYPVKWDTGSVGGGRRVCGETYHPTDTGIPEWSSAGWSGTDPKPIKGPGINANLHALYRDVQVTTQAYELLPVVLMQNGPFTRERGITGDAAIRAGAYATDNTRAAALAYLDRQMTFVPWTKDGTGGHDVLALQMYADWRDLVAQPKWVGRPDVPENPADMPAGGAKEIAAGVRAGEIDFRFDWAGYTTAPITNREVQVSLDNVQFTDAAVVHAGNAVGTAGLGILTGFRPGTLHNVRWRQQNAHGWSRWTPTWPLSLPTGKDVAKYKAPRNEITTAGTASGTLTRLADPALYYNPYPGNDMPYFKPVEHADDLSRITEFVCGAGYWTGGTGPISASYQWQRSPDDASWSDIGGATGKTYLRGPADIGRHLRCRITVNGVRFDTAPALCPAARTFGQEYLIKTEFDAMFAYEWPDIAVTCVRASKDHLPHLVPEGSPDNVGGIWASKEANDPYIDLLITSELAAGTYDYRVECSFGQYAPRRNSAALAANDDHTLSFSETGDAGDATVWVRETIPAGSPQPASYIFQGAFTVAAGDAGKPLHVRFRNESNTGGIAGGSPGLLALEIRKIA